MKYDEYLDSVKASVRISFEPTINCNLRCPMCDRTQKDDYARHRDEKLSYETTKAFLHEVGSLKIRYFPKRWSSAYSACSRSRHSVLTRRGSQTSS